MRNTEAEQQEPSMEEILASIRRIISEDGKEGKEQSPALSSPTLGENLAVGGNSDDVLELTNLVGDDGEVKGLEESGDGPPAQQCGDEVALERVDEVLEVEGCLGPEGNGLLSEDKAAAVADAIAKLVRAMPVAEPPSAGGRALEEIVKPLMRPLLRRWLDDNLPPLVERIVREEVERVVHRARDR